MAADVYPLVKPPGPEFINAKCFGTNLIARIDEWRCSQIPNIARSDAMRLLMEVGLLYEKATRKRAVEMHEAGVNSDHPMIRSRVRRDRLDALRYVAQNPEKVYPSLLD